MALARTDRAHESVELPCLHDRTKKGLITWPACLQVKPQGAGFSKAQEEAPARMDPEVRNTGDLHPSSYVADP